MSNVRSYPKIKKTLFGNQYCYFSEDKRIYFKPHKTKDGNYSKYVFEVRGKIFWKEIGNICCSSVTSLDELRQVYFKSFKEYQEKLLKTQADVFFQRQNSNKINKH